MPGNQPSPKFAAPARGVFHLWVWRFVWIFIAPLLHLIFRYRCKIFRPPGKAPFLVVSNHTTNLDPFFVGSSFPGQLYYVASEHVFRLGFGSALLRFFFDPIRITKGSSDTAALRAILGRLKGGRNVCLFAEGNRSFSGLTGKTPESTGKLARLAAETAGAALVTYRIRGGYFAAPRWGRKTRKGPVWGEAVACYSPESLRAMKPEEINARIREDIYEDAYETMKAAPRPYRSKAGAEDLETGLYLCPRCGRVGTLHSRGDRFWCDCGLSCRYDEYGALHDVSAMPPPPSGGGPFTTVRDWWLWQYDAMEAQADRGCSDEGEVLYGVDPRCGAVELDRGRLSLGLEGLRCGSFFFPLDDILELVITGQRTLSFTAGGKLYELRNGRPRSAAKYQRVFELLTGKGRG